MEPQIGEKVIVYWDDPPQEYEIEKVWFRVGINWAVTLKGFGYVNIYDDNGIWMAR